MNVFNVLNLSFLQQLDFPSLKMYVHLLSFLLRDLLILNMFYSLHNDTLAVYGFANALARASICHFYTLA